ncbi:hypothetical protein D3C81_1760320 [compost metagenome]
MSRVYLTDKGKELCLQVRAAFANMEQKYFGALTPEDKEKMKEGLTLVRDRLLQHGEDEDGGKPFDL